MEYYLDLTGGPVSSYSLSIYVNLNILQPWITRIIDNFFWEVKQFFAKPQLVESKKPEQSLLNTVKSVVSSSFNNSPPSLNTVDGIVNSGMELKHKTNILLNSFNGAMEREKPSCRAYTNNVTTNLFNLNEQSINIGNDQKALEILGLQAQQKDNQAASNSFNATAPGTTPISMPKQQKYVIPGTKMVEPEEENIFAKQQKILKAGMEVEPETNPSKTTASEYKKEAKKISINIDSLRSKIENLKKGPSIQGFPTTQTYGQPSAKEQEKQKTEELLKNLETKRSDIRRKAKIESITMPKGGIS